MAMGLQASWRGKRRGRAPMAEINVTPFVDVMLVLLIIFMVTAPMMQQGIDVDLPNTTTQNLRVRNEPLIITVKMAAILEGRPDKEVYLRADKEAPYGAVVKVMAAARAGGAKSLGIVTEPE